MQYLLSKGFFVLLLNDRYILIYGLYFLLKIFFCSHAKLTNLQNNQLVVGRFSWFDNYKYVLSYRLLLDAHYMNNHVFHRFSSCLLINKKAISLLKCLHFKIIYIFLVRVVISYTFEILY